MNITTKDMETRFKALETEVHGVIKNFDNFPRKGVKFKDVMGFFQNPEMVKAFIHYFAFVLRSHVDAVVAIDARGFLLGSLLSVVLDVPLVVARKSGKLPGEVISVKYKTEYSMEEIGIQKGAIKSGARVVVVDDLLATGGTASAVDEIVEKAGGKVVAFLFLIVLNFLGGSEKLGKSAKLFHLLEYGKGE